MASSPCLARSHPNNLSFAESFATSTTSFAIKDDEESQENGDSALTTALDAVDATLALQSRATSGAVSGLTVDRAVGEMCDAYLALEDEGAAATDQPPDLALALGAGGQRIRGHGLEVLESVVALSAGVVVRRHRKSSGEAE